MSRRLATDQSGFTIVEVLIAAVILVVGILGVATIIDQATANTTSTKAREQGVALQREIVDAARSIGYDQLGPSVAAGVQGIAGLGDSSVATGGWTIRRRGVTYTVAVGACSVDDPTDGYGHHDAATFCARGTGAATPAQCRATLAGTGDIRGNGSATGSTIGDCGLDVDLDARVDQLTEEQVGSCTIGPCGTGTAPDDAPDDYKRVVVLVTWDRGTGDRFALQSETLPNPGLAGAPTVTGLTANPDSSASAPITAAGTSAINFTATTTGKAVAVTWYIDGTPRGSASPTPGDASTWTFPWALGTVTTAVGAQPAPTEVVDGPYVISAKAFDRYDQYGMPATKTVVLNRRAPFAPTNFAGGRNSRHGIVEFEWSPNRARDIKTYRIYRENGTGWTLVCDTNHRTCEDSSPPSGTLRYKAVAVDTDGAGLREGDVATLDVGNAGTPPHAPQNLRLQSIDATGGLQLAWDAPSGGQTVDFYRIYRDGQQVADRYDRTGDLTYTDNKPLPGAHDYYVTAVGNDFSESNFSNRLTVAP